MKKLLLSLLLFPVLASAQTDFLPDCLRTAHYFRDGYYGLVERMLLPPADDKSVNNSDRGNIWGFVRMPSFSTEECVCCTIGDSGYKLVLRQAEKSIWSESYHKVYDKIESEPLFGNIPVVRVVRNNVRYEDLTLDMNIREKQLDITDEQASVLSTLFCLAIGTSTSLIGTTESYSIRTNEDGIKSIVSAMGLDGVITMLFHNANAAEYQTGTGDRLKSLDKITDIMLKAVLNGDNTLLQTILPDARALTLEFRELLPAWAQEYLDVRNVF